MATTGKSKYYEIRERILDKILSGEYPQGSHLPSEPQLVGIYGASRGTIRLALGTLEREGVIARRPGVGTIVVRRPKQALILSFTEQVRKLGIVPSTQVLSRSIIMASEAEGRVCEAFLRDCDEAKQVSVLRIERLRCADDLPVARQVIFLRAADFRPNMLEEENLAGSIFAIYNRYQRRAAWADEIILARKPSDEEIELLKMQNMSASNRFVYVRDRITYDSENMPLEVLNSVERSDFFVSYRYRILAEQ